MADQDTRPFLLKLPLEIRHVIYEHTAVRKDKPKKLLRRYFENVEIKATIAQQTANNPTGPTPVAAQAVGSYDEDASDIDDAHPEIEGDSENDQEDSEEGEEENAEDDGDEEDDEEAEENDDMEDVDEEESAADQENATMQDAGNVVQTMSVAGLPSLLHAAVQVQPPATAQGQSGVAASAVPTSQPADNANAINDGEIDREMEDAGQGEEEEDNGDEEGEGDDDQGEDDDEEGEDDGEGAEGDDEDAQPSPVPAPVIHPHRKWRHIPKFMRLTHSPPPKELLMACKDLNNEAKDWYYDVAILKIDATASFAHTTFFEEAFEQIFDAAFSPMENIRKVEVTFAWDTAWIRSARDDAVSSIFPALLRERAVFVHKILRQAPDLTEVKIHWHDSANDDESTTMKAEILEPFLELPAALTIEDHYIASDAKPSSRSIAGKRRLEFKRILDNGMQRLF